MNKIAKAFIDEIEKIALSEVAIKGAVRKRVADLRKLKKVVNKNSNPGSHLTLETAERGTLEQLNRMAEKHKRLYTSPAEFESMLAGEALWGRFTRIKGTERGKGNLSKAIERYSKAQEALTRHKAISGEKGLLTTIRNTDDLYNIRGK
tara:strand:- start:328 stop:774 length:447 start_codon:yes stop_codon:yes gene_type:complete